MGVCVTNKTGFGFDDRIYRTFIQLVTTVQKLLSDTLSSSSDWTIHGSYFDFQLNWTPLLRCTPSYSFVVLLQFSWLCPLIIPGHGPHGKHRFLPLKCVFFGPLPSNICPIVESVTSGMCSPSRCLAMGICVTIQICRIVWKEDCDYWVARTRTQAIKDCSELFRKELHAGMYGSHNITFKITDLRADILYRGSSRYEAKMLTATPRTSVSKYGILTTSLNCSSIMDLHALYSSAYFGYSNAE
jgi:hypothetical protein